MSIMHIRLRCALAVSVVALILPGCGALPSMKYCDKVTYIRDGSVITVHAECRAPIGGGLGGF